MAGSPVLLARANGTRHCKAVYTSASINLCASDIIIITLVSMFILFAIWAVWFATRCYRKPKVGIQKIRGVKTFRDLEAQEIVLVPSLWQRAKVHFYNRGIERQNVHAAQFTAFPRALSRLSRGSSLSLSISDWSDEKHNSEVVEKDPFKSANGGLTLEEALFMPTPTSFPEPTHDFYDSLPLTPSPMRAYKGLGFGATVRTERGEAFSPTAAAIEAKSRPRSEAAVLSLERLLTPPPPAYAQRIFGSQKHQILPQVCNL